jgi:choline dehydrogenase
MPYSSRSSATRRAGPSSAAKWPDLVEDYRTTLDLTHRFVEAAQRAGIPPTGTSTAGARERIYSQMSRNGRFRGSTARTSWPGEGRPNLRIETKAFATKLLFEGKRCVGVAFRQNDQERQVMARAVICPAAPTRRICCSLGRRPGRLGSISVGVVHDLPGVGANLSDHYAITSRIASRMRCRSTSCPRRGLSADCPLADDGRGALTFGVSSAQASPQPGRGLASPDIQLLFSPASYDQNKFGELERGPA